VEEYNDLEDTQEAAAFYFDEAFIDESDPGVPVEVEIKGRKAVIHLTRGVSLHDKLAAKKQAVRHRIRPDGSVEIQNIDEEIFAVELLARSVKSWPFVFRGSNRPVPVTRENIKKMLSDVSEQLQAIVLNMTQKQEESLVPFESK
jgi:hypothetical protein